MQNQCKLNVIKISLIVKLLFLRRPFWRFSGGVCLEHCFFALIKVSDMLSGHVQIMKLDYIHY